MPRLIPAGQTKHEMAVKASKAWPGWLDEIKETTQDKLGIFKNLAINNGTFIISNGKAGNLEEENFQAIVEALKSQKESYFDVERLDIPGFNPKVNCPLIKAIYLPNEGAINPNHLLSALKHIIENSNNATDFQEDVTDIAVATSKLDFLKTNEGKLIKAKKYLISAGAYSYQLIKKIPSLHSRIQPILAGVGLSLVVDQVPSEIIFNIRTPNRAGACGLHVLPRGINSLYIGATNNICWLPKKKPRLTHLSHLLQSATNQLSQSLGESRLLSYAVGNRAITMDSFPLIGKTSIENLWILLGTFRDGLHLSPIFSEIIADDMLGLKKSAFSYSSDLFYPERFPIQTMSPEEAISNTVYQLMSGAYEYEMQLPKPGWDNMLRDAFYVKIRDLYNELGANIAISPEILVTLEGVDLSVFLKKYLCYINGNISSLSKNS